MGTDHSLAIAALNCLSLVFAVQGTIAHINFVKFVMQIIKHQTGTFTKQFP